MKAFIFSILLLFSCALIAQPNYANEWGSSITTGNYNAASSTLVRGLITNNATNGSAGLVIRNGAQTLRLFTTIDTSYLTASRPLVLPATIFTRITGNTGDILTRAANGRLIFSPNNAVPTSRTITINGTTQDLSANRSWTISASATAAGSTGQLQFNTSNALNADANLSWDNTNKRLGIREATPAASLDVRSSTNTSLTTALRVGGSSNNDYFNVRGDGFIGFGATPFSSLNYRFRVGSNLNVYFGVMGGQTSMGSVDDATNNIQFTVNGNPLVWQVGTTEFVRLTSSQFRVQNTVFDVNQFIGTGQAVSLLNLNNTNNQVATSILNYTIAGVNLAQLRAEATAGDDNFQIRVTNSAGSLVEAARFQGSGNVLIGTTTDVTTSILTINSTTKGILLPRLTTTQINAIASPATGLTVYNTTENTLCFFNGSTWQKVTSTNL